MVRCSKEVTVKRKFLAPAVAVFATAALALSACGEAPEGGADAKKSDFKACIISDEGGWDDKSFNQSSKDGFDRAVKDFGLQEAVAESKDKSDYSQNVDTMVQNGCNIIYGVGFNLAAELGKSAKQNTDIEYALVDSYFSDENGETVEYDNAKPLVFNTAEAAYLAGYVAAGTSETGKVATFGGMQIPSVSIFMDGFADGVDRYNKDHDGKVELLGWDKAKQKGSFVGNFSDQGQGQALTDQFISQGADIVMPVAGPVGLGAAESAKKHGDVSLVWVDADGYETTEYGDLMLTSVLKEMSNAVYDSAKEASEDKFTGEPYVGDLKNEGVSIAPFHDYEDKVSDEVKQGVEKIKQEIIDGTTKVETENAPK